MYSFLCIIDDGINPKHCGWTSGFNFPDGTIVVEVYIDQLPEEMHDNIVKKAKEIGVLLPTYQQRILDKSQIEIVAVYDPEDPGLSNMDYESTPLWI